MGADRFTAYIRNKPGLDTPQKAFRAALEEAYWDYGRAGYTGTIAEKDGFVMIGTVATREKHIGLLIGS
jgi:hypothetical protein